MTKPKNKSLFEKKIVKLKADKESIYTLMEQVASDPDTIAHYEQQAKELGDIDVEIMKEKSKRG